MLLLDVGVHIGGGDATEEFYVFVGVKLGHFPLSGGFGSLEKCRHKRVSGWLLGTEGRSNMYEDFHAFVEAIVHDQGMTHPYTGRLHPR